jgi:hypothetical protein
MLHFRKRLLNNKNCARVSTVYQMTKILLHFDPENRNLKAEIPRLREALSVNPDLMELNDMILGEFK